MITEITKSRTGQHLDLAYIFNNLDNLKSYIFTQDNELLDFIGDFERWKNNFKLTGNNIASISPLWFELITKDNIEKYASFKHIFSAYEDAVKNFIAERWSELFNNKGECYSSFKHLYEKEIIDREVLKNVNVSSGRELAYDNFLNDTSVDIDHQLLADYLSTKAVKDDFASHVFDKLTTPTTIDSKRILHISSLIFGFSKRIKQSSHVDSLFDDYLMRILKDCSIDEIIPFVEDRNANVMMTLALRCLLTVRLH